MVGLCEGDKTHGVYIQKPDTHLTAVSQVADHTGVTHVVIETLNMATASEVCQMVLKVSRHIRIRVRQLAGIFSYKSGISIPNLNIGYAIQAGG
ncbi:hypothetical protein ANN_20015 [Periplaneta americana]|uniref:Per a allergen n=1 Tax=Periplaneta americana TaxID=6978 RepID=A0ABQ8SBQ7_PERAM|nr:hypothetical protein ANN_20015 [Periplaneta americana]